MTDFTFYRRIDFVILKEIEESERGQLGGTHFVVQRSDGSLRKKNLFLSLKKYDSRWKKNCNSFFIARGAYLHLFRLLSFTMQFTVMKISVLPGTPLYYSVKMPL